jgi:hypothetical protein
VSAARNHALTQASGTFVALLDSDDLWMPDYLNAQLRTLAIHPAADVVTSNAINLGGPLDGQPYWPAADVVRPIRLIDMIRKEDSVHIMSVFRRTVADRVGGFVEGRHVNEDYEFWLRAAVAGSGFVADFTPRAFYRRRSGSGSADEERMIAGIITVLEALRPSVPADSVETAAIDAQVRRFTHRLHVCRAHAAIAAGDYDAALQSLRRIPADDRGAALSFAVRVAALWPPALAHGVRLQRALRARFSRRAPAAA